MLIRRIVTVFISLMVMVITSGCFVAVRIGARIVAGQLGADDYAIIASMVLQPSQLNMVDVC